MSAWVWQTNQSIGLNLKSTSLQEVKCIARPHDCCAMSQYFSAGKIQFFFYCGSQRTFVCEPKQKRKPLKLAYSSFQFVSGFLLLYYLNSLYLGQLNRLRLNFREHIVILLRECMPHTMWQQYLRSCQFIDLNRNIFRIPFSQVSHDDQFEIFRERGIPCLITCGTCNARVAKRKSNCAFANEIKAIKDKKNMTYSKWHKHNAALSEQ